MAALHPPRPELALTLGVTGHRHLDAAAIEAARATLAIVFTRVKSAVSALAPAHPNCFAECPPSFRLVSALAKGADQIAAEVALDNGFAVHALLPFPRSVYAEDFDGPALSALDALLARAESIWSLSTPRSAGDQAYVIGGDATVAQSDLLIAIWDGQAARGPGGTGDVIANAVRRGVPVIHLPVDPLAAPAILWSGFDGIASESLRPDDAPRRSLEGDTLEQLVKTLLAPPAHATEISTFFAERERRVRLRPEWSLLLAITGVQRLQRSTFRAERYTETARLEWLTYRTTAEAACGPFAAMATLEAAFAWADGLASHYATVFRSGVVLNFAGAALAVVLALLGGPMRENELPLRIGELSIIIAIVANTAFGTRRQWHRRWLDYRFLAEQLRPLRSLKLLGASSSPLQPRGGTQRWTDWYAQAIWRALGAPPDIAGPEVLRQLARHIAAHELDGQIAYHRATARRMHMLDHRLHRLGLALFVLTIGIGLGTLGWTFYNKAAVEPYVDLLGALSAALPTLGAAIFGIRAAGDFAGTAGRSHETARRLIHAADLLRRDDLDRTAAVRTAEQAAGIMLGDLAEWRTTYLNRTLAIPS